ncbi:MAG UNVERIFIED_CONTAM: hypothetical protein LVR18_16385 [Planctomycetaceae bacterium]|jgi:hypothetical protein
MTTTPGVVPGKMRGVMCPDIDTPSLILLAKALPVMDDRKVAQSDPATGPIRELGQPTIEFGRFKKIEGSKWRSSLQSLLNLSNELYREVRRRLPSPFWPIWLPVSTIVAIGRNNDSWV